MACIIKKCPRGGRAGIYVAVTRHGEPGPTCCPMLIPSSNSGERNCTDKSDYAATEDREEQMRLGQKAAETNLDTQLPRKERPHVALGLDARALDPVLVEGDSKHIPEEGHDKVLWEDAAETLSLVETVVGPCEPPEADEDPGVDALHQDKTAPSLPVSEEGTSSRETGIRTSSETGSTSFASHASGSRAGICQGGFHPNEYFLVDISGSEARSGARTQEQVGSMGPSSG
jgi:hypothetical protein